MDIASAIHWTSERSIHIPNVIAPVYTLVWFGHQEETATSALPQINPAEATGETAALLARGLRQGSSDQDRAHEIGSSS